MYSKAKLAPLATTGNNTHASQGVPDATVAIGFSFNLTVAGATPTVTFKLQGSMDSGDVPDSTSNWFDLAMLPGASDTSVATDTKTAVASYAYFIAAARNTIRKVRLVASANTNVTYDADLATK